MPVLHAGGDVHHIAGHEWLRLFAPFLIPASARYAHQHLSAALGRMVDMPVVAAAGLEGYIHYFYLRIGHRRQVTLPCEILRIGVVRCAYGEEHGLLKRLAGCLCSVRFCPHVFRHPKSRPRLGPTGIESDMGDDLANLGAGDTVALRLLQVEDE